MGTGFGLTLAISSPPAAGMTSRSLPPSGLITQLDIVEYGSPRGRPL